MRRFQNYLPESCWHNIIKQMETSCHLIDFSVKKFSNNWFWLVKNIDQWENWKLAWKDLRQRKLLFQCCTIGFILHVWHFSSNLKVKWGQNRTSKVKKILLLSKFLPKKKCFISKICAIKFYSDHLRLVLILNNDQNESLLMWIRLYFYGRNFERSQ